jgi:hypothetical protein
VEEQRAEQKNQAAFFRLAEFHALRLAFFFLLASSLSNPPSLA